MAEEIPAPKQVPPGACEVTTPGPGKPGQPGKSGAVTGRILPLGNGGFMVQIRGEGCKAAQWRAFQADGDARMKEIPDRRENQLARRIRTSPNGRNSPPRGNPAAVPAPP